MIETGEAFRPAREYRTLLHIYVLLFLLVAVLWWYLPVVFVIPVEATVVSAVSIAALAILGFAWAHLYHGTVVYRLTDEEIVWKRGIWFRTTGIVPYNRITNVDTEQGPVMRRLGIAKIRVQTAGYSAAQQKAEIAISGMREFEGIQEQIMDIVRRRRPSATESGTEEGPEDGGQVVNELVRIRERLEEISSKLDR
ncbi:MAG: PH domain-containing protein [Methanomassiliicoccales archaeon]